MARTVKSSFVVFNRDVVNLDPNLCSTAIKSRDWLISQIMRKCNLGELPPSYKAMNINYGSFSRMTKIRPLDDIDIMICFKGMGGRYVKTEDNNIFNIVMPDHAKPYKDMKEGQILNSRKVVEALKKIIGIIPQYRNPDYHRDHEAMTLKLASYEWNFDVVPCFHTTSDFYLIPDGNGKWKRTDPRIDRSRLKRLVNMHGSIIQQTIRTMKYWKRRAWGDCLPSYVFEQMLLDKMERMEIYDVERNVMVLLGYISSAINNPINDPKNYQGDLNTLGKEDRERLALSASRHLQRVSEAVAAEMLNDHQEAIGIWRDVFGEEFPSYEIE